MSKKYTLLTSTAFKRDYKKMQKRNYDMSLLNDVIETLLSGNRLPEKNKDHALTGDWAGHRECHIQPDWLLVYKIFENDIVLTLLRTGTHSDLKF